MIESRVYGFSHPAVTAFLVFAYVCKSKRERREGAAGFFFNASIPRTCYGVLCSLSCPFSPVPSFSKSQEENGMNWGEDILKDNLCLPKKKQKLKRRRRKGEAKRKGTSGFVDGQEDQKRKT